MRKRERSVGDGEFLRLVQTKRHGQGSAREGKKIKDLTLHGLGPTPGERPWQWQCTDLLLAYNIVVEQVDSLHELDKLACAMACFGVIKRLRE